jgi:hypothetical protein
MALNEVALWSEIFTGFATFLGLFFVAYEIRRTRLNEKRENIFETLKMWTDMEESHRREREMDWEDFEDFKTKYAHGDQVRFRDFLNIMNFLETLGDLIQEGILDKEITINTWGTATILYYARYRDILTSYREELFPQWYEKVDWLAKESSLVFPEAAKGFAGYWEQQTESLRK